MDEARLAPGLRRSEPVLGIDCGGSSTRLAVVAEGRVVGRGRAGPFNALLQSGAAAELAAIIGRHQVVAAGIGLPGVRTAALALELSQSLSAAAGLPVTVCSDAAAAHLGAFGGGSGVAVVSGTGSVALGIDDEGREAWAGGHGFLLGDEGGAYWIGRQAVRRALRAVDGVEPANALTALVEAAAGCELEALVAALHRAPGDRSLLARLAPAIAGSALPEAIEVLEAAGRALGELADAVLGRLGPLRVCGVGGVFASSYVRTAFATGREVVDACFEPEVGAAILALGARRPLS